MGCEFNISKLSDKFSELSLCDDTECVHCMLIQKEYDTYSIQRQDEYRKLYSNEKFITIGISPTPDYISYWKSPEGLYQIIEGLFRGEVREIEPVTVLLSFGFKEVKGFSIPMFCLELQLFGDEYSMSQIESELTTWSPRVCGVLYETSSPFELDLGGGGKSYDFFDFQEFLLEYEYEYLNELSLLSPIRLNWNEFMDIRQTGVLKTFT